MIRSYIEYYIYLIRSIKLSFLVLRIVWSWSNSNNDGIENILIKKKAKHVNTSQKTKQKLIDYLSSYSTFSSDPKPQMLYITIYGAFVQYICILNILNKRGIWTFAGAMFLTLCTKSFYFILSEMHVWCVLPITDKSTCNYFVLICYLLLFLATLGPK